MQAASDKRCTDLKGKIETLTSVVAAAKAAAEADRKRLEEQVATTIEKNNERANAVRSLCCVGLRWHARREAELHDSASSMITTPPAVMRVTPAC